MKQQNKQYKDFEKAQNQQKRRYKERVLKMLNKDFSNTYFLTITFNEKTIKETSANTRLRYVKDFMIKQFKDYVLNRDYGTEHNREHYHAIGISKYKIICFDAWKKYGSIDAKKVYQNKRLTSKNSTATADYLTAHAFKETTKGEKIIYSRKQSKRNKQFKALINKRLDAWNKTPRQQ